MYKDREKRNATARAYRLKNIEKERERERNRKARELARNPELVRARQRKLYAKDPNAAAKQNERRQRREPSRIVRATKRLFLQGTIGIDECIKRIDYAIEQSNKAIICNNTESDQGRSSI